MALRWTIGICLAAIAWLAWAPLASGAAPANDDFAAAQVLDDPLPISTSGLNVEATREDEEPFLVFGAGHTIWYEWEAAETDFVTVGTCGTAFGTQVGVYVGTAVNALTRIADSSDAGPGCVSGEGQQATFEAVEGTAYEIVVDGDGFHLPEWPQPVTEGAIALQVEATPTPVNDDFEDAATLSGRIEEEPGAPPFYFGSSTDYNWGAGKEPDEPDHAGDPGGASVWYTWTAPATGVARFSAQGNGFKTLISVYEGDALGDLTPLASGEFLGTGDVPVTAGATYRIAVDGKRDAVSGEASTAQFWLYVQMHDLQLPAPPMPPPSPPPGDTTPPETRIAKHFLKRMGPRILARLVLRSSEPGSTFRCRLDGRPFRPCRSSQGVRGLEPGRHRFEAFAVDVAGNADPTPAVARFKGRAPERPGNKGRSPGR